MMKSTYTNPLQNKYEITKKFINHLDLLVGSDDRSFYGQVSLQKIDAMIQNFSIVDKLGQKFKISCSVQEFQKFAPGVYLMFKLLKNLIFMFAAISIIAIVQLILLIKSPFYQGYQNIVRINLLRLTIASLQSQNYCLYIVLDLISVLIRLGFMIYWSQKLRDYANECNQNHRLPSYLTVQLKKLQQNFSQQSLAQYLKLVLKIQPQQIYTARNYGNFLEHYAQLTKKAIDIRILKQLFVNQENILQKHTKASKYLQKFLQLKHQFCSIESAKFNQKKYRPKQVFIVLKSYKDREKLLLNNSQSLLSCFNKDSSNIFQFSACQVEPQAINWQNVGISFANYSFRAFIVFLLLIIVTFIGVCLIFVLEILETSSIGDAYYYRQLKFQQKYLLKKSQCVPSQHNQCLKQIVDYSKLVSLIILTPFIIFIIKKVIMGLLSYFVKFRKYPSQVQKIKSQTISLTVFYFIVMGALHLILYLKAQNSQGKTLSIYQLLQPIIIKMFKITNYSPASIHLYSDFSLDWYKQATFFIIVICSTSFNISNCFKFIVNLICFQLQKIKARKQKTLYGLKKCLHGIDLHMEHVNASMIVINYFVFLYGCPIPLTVIFGLFNIIILFYITKFTFIKYGNQPLRIGHSINRTVSNMILLGIVIHCLMTPIFIGAQGIGIDHSHYKNLSSNDNYDKSVIIQSLSVVQRYKKFGLFYLIIAGFTISYILFRKILIRQIIQKFKQKFFTKNEKDSELTKEIEYLGLYPSYSMHSNPYYTQIMKNIYLLNRVQAKRATCPLPHSLKILKSDVEIQNQPIKLFDEIVEINRQYLDKQKYQNIYKKVEQLALLKQSNYIYQQSLLEQKKTDDRIEIVFDNMDQIKQEEV